jgi:murein tripeptide amidase MpaA
MNRQYPFHWQDEERDAGPYPLSEPESRAQVDFVLDHMNIFGVHTYHTYCGAILRPYSNMPDDEMREPDLAIYKALGDRGTEITGYPNISVYHDFSYDPKKSITGAFDDWAYDYYGVFAFTIEFWSMAKASGVEVDDFIEFARNPPEEATLKMLAWNDTKLNGEGFVPWKPFDHPQLGRVEIGGWKTKFTFQNPPPKYLKAECEKLTRFALSHASTAPRLRTRLETKQLSPGLRRIELVVENTGYLPTNITSVATDKKLAKPVQATLGLPPEASLISGQREVNLGHLAGRSALTANRWKNPPFFQGLPSDYARQTTWIICGEGPVRIDIRGGRAGTVRLETK